MTDVFALLDAAIRDIGQKRRSELPQFPSITTPPAGTGTSKPLEEKGVPALPVVPVEYRTVHGETARTFENPTNDTNGRSEIAPKEYPFKDTGSTGSAGTPEDFCRTENSRELLEHGNNGNDTARPVATVKLEFPEIADLAERGLVIDFETRSIANLKQVGPFVYADRGWTQVWVACYAIGGGPVSVWRPGESVPADLAAHVRAGLPLIAHNASFERAIWNKIMTPRHGWPEPKLEQWHCTAAMAAAMALPRKLEEAAKVLACSSQKDMSGHRLMLQMARPCSTENVPCFLCGAVGEEASDANCPCQHDHSWRIMVKWVDDTESMKRGTEYCIRDVETERELLTKLRPLPAMEREVWLLDQRINERGVSIDVTAVHSARRIVGDRLKELNAELVEVTKGAVGAATQIEKLIAWLRSMGVELPNGAESNDLDKEQINVLLKRELPAECRRALLIRLEAAKTSTSKLDAYAQRTNPDGRMRDNLIFHGAGRTGRWSGKGAQLQNVPRPPASMKPADIDAALKFIIKGSALKDLEEGFHGVRGLEIISGCLRAMLTAAPGHHLIAADYNAIEARGTAWLAGAIGMLSVFQRNEDPYLYMACQIYNKEQGSLTKKDNPMERQLGKIAVLGLGYQMGAERFRQTCGKDGVLITCEQAE
jgi:DNA polymerase bacteriophage-type